MSRILVIKLGALGDVVMATSSIRQIMKRHHDAAVHLLTAPHYTEIFKNWDDLQVKSFNRKGLAETLRAIRWIRAGGFSRVYDLQSNDRTAIICALSGIKEIVGNHPRYPYNFHPPDKYTGQCHIYDRNLQVLQSAGIKTVSEPPLLISSVDDRKYVSGWMAEHHLLEKSFVIIHAGASPGHPEKCWPYYAELAAHIDNSGYRLVWAGTESEAVMNKQYAARYGIDASNQMSILQLAELGRYARFAMTNDSGPMHILSASGIPVYTFFGPTNWKRSHAVGQQQNVLSCDLLGIKSEQPQQHENLRAISVDLVIERMRSDGLIN